MDNKDLLLEFDQKQFSIIESWHNVSIKEDFLYVKYFSNWISFNAICYALFHKEAVRERVDIDDIKKLPEIKSRLELEESIYLEEGQISATERNIKLKLKFPEKINFTIKQRFTEDYIFKKFSNKFQNDFVFNENDLDLIALKDALKKHNGRIYVIDMSRSDQYELLIDDIDKMSSNGIITLLEDNSLSSIVNVLYQIRCNIFHGGKEPGDNHDDLIVKAANPILNRLVEFFIYIDPNERLDRIKDIIKYRHEIPKSEVLWGGAYLIITYDNYSLYNKDHNERYPDDLIIRTNYCKELSWLIYELCKVYQSKLGREMFRSLGEAMNNSLQENKDIYNVFSDTLIKYNELVNNH